MTMDFSEMERRRKQRKANFTDVEIRCLVEAVSKTRAIIMSRFQTVMTIQKKREIWRKITAEVNARGSGNRTEDDVRRKWKDLKFWALTNLKDQSKNNGGPSCKPVPFFDKILDIMGRKADLTATGNIEENGIVNCKIEGDVSTDPVSSEIGEAEYIRCKLEKDDDMHPVTADIFHMQHDDPSFCTANEGCQRTSEQPASADPLETSSTLEEIMHPASATAVIETTQAAATSEVNTSPRTSVSSARIACLRQNKRHYSDPSDEEAILFKRWMAADTAKNEKKVKLMDLQETKLRLEILKLERELQLEQLNNK